MIDSVYRKVTEQVTGIKLESPPARKKKVENPISVVVLSKGVFKSKAVVVFPAKFIEAVIAGMSKCNTLSEEEGDAYFKEYMNIFFGRFISEINNVVGRSSRFVIPVLLRGSYRETAENEYSNRIDVGFMSEQGRIDFALKYEVLPEHSSN